MSQSNEPAKKKMKLEDSEDESTLKKENLEKSLTNLQIDMLEVSERMEYMMTALEKFVDEFKANQITLMQDVKGFKKEAQRLTNIIYEKQG